MELLVLGPVELRAGGTVRAVRRAVHRVGCARGRDGRARPRRGDAAQPRLALSRELGLADDPGYALDGLAAAAAALGQPERAARLTGAADAVFRAVETRLQRFEAERREAVLAQLREELGPEALAAAMAQGATRIAPSPLA
jgi:hypothetical protein